MAGSYGHVAHGWSLIENMGDAHEAVEELMWLVLYFAAIASKQGSTDDADATIQAVLKEIYYPMVRGESPQDAAYIKVQELMSQ